jgi:hypothetical protein
MLPRALLIGSAVCVQNGIRRVGLLQLGLYVASPKPTPAPPKPKPTPAPPKPTHAEAEANSCTAKKPTPAPPKTKAHACRVQDEVVCPVLLACKGGQAQNKTCR